MPTKLFDLVGGAYAKIATIITLVAVALFAALRLVSVGRKQAEAATAKAALDAAKARRESDDQTETLAPADLDRRYTHWLRDGKR